MIDEDIIENSKLYSKDLAPIALKDRTWGTFNFAALWISMSMCIPTYMLASSLIEGGMNWWQSVLTIFLGNLIVLIPMILNGHAGTKYGISFPVFARASFGTFGANIPAILRAIVACGWFGIQTWIGGAALYQILKIWFPSLPDGSVTGFFPDLLPFLCFIFFLLINMYVVYLGVESIRKLLVFKAVFLPVAAIALLCWAIFAANGLGPILSQPSKFDNDSTGFWKFFFPALTGMVGYWATLSLNIPDFTRYAKDQNSQIKGQILGLPTSMTVFAFIGVVVTSATFIIYGKTIWDPVILAGKFENKFLVAFAMLAIALSTLATNIAANIVSPANDFAHLNPKKINFRTGGYITGIIGVLICPWKLIADPSGYIFTWLVGYSSLLGPIGGILIADYYFVKKQTLVLNDLYQSKGLYTYSNGINRNAVVALIIGILPNIAGFLVTIKAIPDTSVPQWITHLYNYAWFVGFFVSALVYLFLMKSKKTETIK